MRPPRKKSESSRESAATKMEVMKIHIGLVSFPLLAASVASPQGRCRASLAGDLEALRHKSGAPGVAVGARSGQDGHANPRLRRYRPGVIR